MVKKRNVWNPKGNIVEILKDGQKVLFNTPYQKDIKGKIYTEDDGSVYVMAESKIEGSKGRDKIYVGSDLSVKYSYFEGISNIRGEK